MDGCACSVRLAAENKITSKNTWSLHLIDHLSDVVKVEQADSGNPNFQQASMALQTGVQIYCSRVDNAHAQAHRMLSGLYGTLQQQEDDEADDEHTDCANNEESNADRTSDDRKQSASRKKGKRRRNDTSFSDNSSTLEDPSHHTLTSLSNGSCIDPIFHKAAKQLDEDGAHGLLLRSFPLHKGNEIAFDPDAVLNFDPWTSHDTADIVWSKESANNVSHSPLPLDRAVSYIESCNQNGEAVRLTPALDMLYYQAGLANRDEPGSSECCDDDVETVENAHALASSSLDEEDDFMPYEPPDPMHISSLNADGKHEGCTAQSPQSPPQPGNADAVVEQDAPDPGGIINQRETHLIRSVDSQGGDEHASGSTGALEQCDGVQWLLGYGYSHNQYASPMHPLIASTTGPKYWRFFATNNKPPNHPRNVTQRKNQESRGSRKPSSEISIDFLSAYEEDDTDFQPATRDLDITFKSRKKANTLLPDDFDFTARQFAHLALLPSYAVVPKLNRNDGNGCDYARSANGDATTEDMHNAATVDENLLEFGNDDEAVPPCPPETDEFRAQNVQGDSSANNDPAPLMQPSQGINGLVEAPRKPQRERVNYATRSKQVNVKRLKEEIERGIFSKAQDADDNTAEHASVEFNEIINDSSLSSAAHNNNDLSVQMCFICLLHVANEQQLTLCDSPALNKLRVSMNG